MQHPWVEEEEAMDSRGARMVVGVEAGAAGRAVGAIEMDVRAAGGTHLPAGTAVAAGAPAAGAAGAAGGGGQMSRRCSRFLRRRRPASRQVVFLITLVHGKHITHSFVYLGLS